MTTVHAAAAFLMPEFRADQRRQFIEVHVCGDRKGRAAAAVTGNSPSSMNRLAGVRRSPEFVDRRSERALATISPDAAGISEKMRDRLVTSQPSGLG